MSRFGTPARVAWVTFAGGTADRDAPRTRRGYAAGAIRPPALQLRSMIRVRWATLEASIDALIWTSSDPWFARMLQAETALLGVTADINDPDRYVVHALGERLPGRLEIVSTEPASDPDAEDLPFDPTTART
jgi:hypothetical protein